MMKSLLIVVVLASLSISNEAAVIKDEDVTDVAIRSNLGVGTIGSADKLLARNYFSKAAISNIAQYQDITYRGNNIRIGAIRVREVGTSQGATPSIRSGGVGKNFVTIRLTSKKGKGYSFLIEIYGR